jgi:iron complex outermembrane recepter protein
VLLLNQKFFIIIKMFRYSIALLAGVLITIGAFAQNQLITGYVQSDESKQAIADAYVQLLVNKTIVKAVPTDKTGRFELAGIPAGTYTLEALKTGYEKGVFLLTVSAGQTVAPITFSLKEQPFESQEVVVDAFRATAQSPVTLSTLKTADIEAKYVGHDIPTLISSTPSINSYSDAGNGMGYSSFRLRGMDQTRVNMTVNGIPINDAETQGFYTNNFADLASSASEIQIQRGVGTTTNGTAALGGSLNVVTKNLDEKPSFTLHSGYGSFNSRRNTAEFQTGRLAGGKVAFYGRLSDLGSDGYREHSKTHSQSYFLSGGLFGKRSLLKINAWGGIAQSQLAYSAIDKATLESNRRANPLTPEERDEFRQNFLQLQYTYHFSAKLNASASAYYVKGDAPYFDYLWRGADLSYLNAPVDTITRNGDTITTTDFMARYRLNQKFYGAFASLNYTGKKLGVSIGLHANSFVSDHYNQVAWAQTLPQGVQPGHVWYSNTGTKQEMSAFVKANYKVGQKLTLFADVQARQASWKYQVHPTEYLFTDYKVEPMQWLFINPKVGARYTITNQVAMYLNAGISHREPTRNDYLRDDLAWRDVKQDELKPEQVTDVELGTNITTRNLWLNANVYYMLFDNQIANTGLLNQYGSPITQNTGKGTRAGIEIDGLLNIGKRWALTHASSFSANSIQSFTQYFDEMDDQGNVITYGNPTTYKNVQPALTPSIIVNQGVKYSPLSFLSIDVSGRYVGKQYLDNTQTESLSLPSYFTAGAGLSLNLEQWTKVGQQTLSIRANNITSTLYSPAGTLGGWGNTMTKTSTGDFVATTPAAYYPAAKANIFVTLMMRF